MKKLLFIVAFAATALCAKAQTNIQVQYDFGEKRQNITTTLEMFKTDNWGSTFFFVDITHDGKFQHEKGVMHPAPIGAYTEIARGLNFWQNTKLGALSAHVEYNGGLGVVPNVFGYGINNAWLFGAEYFMHSADFRYTLTLEVLYKTIAKAKQDVPMQFTIVWGCNDLFGAKGLNFSGFADFWWETNSWAVLDDEGNQKVDENNVALFEETTGVFISEPQLWYNIGQFFGCPNLNIGGEVEIACNFTGNDTKGWHVNPAAGIKWNF